MKKEERFEIQTSEEDGIQGATYIVNTKMGYYGTIVELSNYIPQSLRLRLVKMIVEEMEKVEF